ncbi:hypothetical protein [Thermomonas fusca]
MTILTVISLLSLLFIVMAGLVVFVEYPRSAIDRTRDELFCLRSRLFEIAHSNRVAFEHPGYRAARDLLNGMIRYAHDVSATHLIFAHLFANREARHIRRAIAASIQRDLNSLPKTTRNDVQQLLTDASEALTQLIVFRSVTLSAFFLCYAALHELALLASSARNGVKQIGAASQRIGAPLKAHKQNVQESMQEVMDHGPMRKVPSLVVREAGRYTTKSQWSGLPMAA